MTRRSWLAAMFVLGVAACGSPRTSDTGDPAIPVDADGDGFTSADDCDDADPRVHPGADEHCDDRDEDCDGAVDEDALDRVLLAADRDRDGHGDLAEARLRCPSVWLAPADDCDDDDPEVFPGAEERCDGRDQDCDGEVDDDPIDAVPGYTDEDGDGWGVGGLAVGCGRAPSPGDCDDSDAFINPDAIERCDEIDWNCDGSTDRGAVDLQADLDGDGFAGSGGPCGAPRAVDHAGLIDCDDTRPDVKPQQVGGRWRCSRRGESCADGFDDDFDRRIDCEDPDCQISPACFERGCDDGFDDDGDGLVDCDDPDCVTNGCREWAAWLDGGVMEDRVSHVTLDRVSGPDTEDYELARRAADVTGTLAVSDGADWTVCRFAADEVTAAREVRTVEDPVTDADDFTAAWSGLRLTEGACVGLTPALPAPRADEDALLVGTELSVDVWTDEVETGSDYERRTWVARTVSSLGIDPVALRARGVIGYCRTGNPLAGFVDADGDGHGDPRRPVAACGTLPSGAVDKADDPDDGDPRVP